VDGHQHLGHGRHAHHVGADGAEKAVFRPRFQVWAGHADVHAAMGYEVLPPGDFQGPPHQHGIVGPAHVGKTGAQAVVVHADQRVVVHQVDVIVDDDDVAQAVQRVQPAAGIGDQEQFRAQGAHHPNRERKLPLRIAFIGVKASLHGHDRHAFEHSTDELARVAHRCRPGKVRNGRVIERRFGLDLSGDTPQAGA